MTYEEAKKAHGEGRKVYRAYVDRNVWQAGQPVLEDYTIGYYLTKAEAGRACEIEVMLADDLKKKDTFVELCDVSEFED